VGISTDRSHTSGKLMVTVFRDMEGILLIEYIKKGSTITGDVLLGNSQKPENCHTANKKAHNSDQRIMLLHDNCRVHKARQVR
jgi:hypothetical protein